MNMITNYLSELDSWLPDAKVIEDVRRIVESDVDGKIEFDSGVVAIPIDANYEVVSKALIKQPEDIGFGSCFRAVVAIGGTKPPVYGIVRARYAFATIWYSTSGELITIDFSEESPV